MRLGLMVRFFDGVDDEWRSPLAEQIASCWPLDDPEVRVWRASANFVCAVTTRQAKYFLRFNHDSERQAQAISAELAFIDHLSQRGVHVARPIPSRDGRLVESVETSLGRFYAVLFEALPGQQMEFDQLDLAGFTRWGRGLGELHRAGQDFHSGDRPGWHDWLGMAREVIPAAETAARRELDVVEAAMNQLPSGEDDFGMIHYDFELDNLCWQGDMIGALDFDDCGPSWYAADIAYALRDLYQDHCAGVNLEDRRLQAFLEGYRQARVMTSQELAFLPLFLRLHNLVTFARTTHFMEGGPLAGEPGWARDLRQRLEGQQSRYREDFESLPAERLLPGALQKDGMDGRDEH